MNINDNQYLVGDKIKPQPMEININQKKISIGDKYQVFIDGRQTHSASTKLFRLLAEMNLHEQGADRPKYSIKKNWSFFLTTYNLTGWDNITLEFRTKSFWKRHYYCQVGQDLYEVFGHRGRKYSVYKNDRQVAWWTQKAVSWFNGDNYTITADKDCNHELLMAFCLIIDNSSNKNSGNALNINVGHIGPQAKKFDPTWAPKY